jgi:hypothetical protein
MNSVIGEEDTDIAEPLNALRISMLRVAHLLRMYALLHLKLLTAILALHRHVDVTNTIALINIAGGLVPGLVVDSLSERLS